MSNEFRNVLVVQARIGSSRLPEKMLAHLGSHRIIDWVIQRLSACRSFDARVIATTHNPADEVLLHLASEYGWSWFRGSEDDVLSRFTACADAYEATTVVRVCADNPFVAPEVIDLLNSYDSGEDTIVFNHRPWFDCDYVDGLGGEKISRAALEILDSQVVEPDLREHVTLAAYRGLHGLRVKGLKAPKQLSAAGVSLDIDTADDLRRLGRFIQEMSIEVDSPATTIVERFIDFEKAIREP